MDWYEALNGSTDYLWFRLDGESVLAEALVTDDFDRLLDVEPGLFELRWWLDEKRRISGFLVVSKSEPDDTNLQHFLGWTEARYPALLRALAPGGRILYEAKNAPAWIELLQEWRRSRGLPELE